MGELKKIHKKVPLEEKHELQIKIIETLDSVVDAIDAKDHYTQMHSNNVSVYAVEIAKAMKMKPTQVEHIKWACKLHDLGKIAVHDYILVKQGKLTEEEWNEIKMHPLVGARILKHLEFLSDVAIIIEQEHERPDGNGYPWGLKGDQINIGAKIVAVADAYDAMTTGRIYQEKKTKEQAIEELVLNKGAQFDPKVVDVFLKVVDKIETPH